MKILHSPINIAGQLTAISRAQRKLGYVSDVMVFNQNDFEYECDINLKTCQERWKIIRAYKILANFLKCLVKYDVFHFHYGRTLLPYKLDLPILRLFGKKIVMQYWGTDVIQFDIAAKRTLFNQEQMSEIFHEQNDDQKRKEIAKMEKMVDVTVVGDKELTYYSPKSKSILKAIDLEKIPFIGLDLKSHTFKIVHAPSNRGVKGTDQIIKTIENLKKEGLKLDFTLVEGKSNEGAMQIYQNADLIIDDILQGPYGILCMEAMALGKPVMCHIGPLLVPNYPGLPIINVNPDNLGQKIKEVMASSSLREKLSHEGREYMEANHDIMKTAQKFIDLYKSL